MSWDLVRVVRDLDKRRAGLDVGEGVILLVLSLHADEHGKAFPTQEVICRETGLCATKVRKAVHFLRDLGLVEIVRGKRYIASVYRLNVEAIGKLAETCRLVVRGEGSTGAGHGLTPVDDESQPVRGEGSTGAGHGLTPVDDESQPVRGEGSTGAGHGLTPVDDESQPVRGEGSTGAGHGLTPVDDESQPVRGEGSTGAGHGFNRCGAPPLIQIDPVDPERARARKLEPSVAEPENIILPPEPASEPDRRKLQSETRAAASSPDQRPETATCAISQTAPSGLTAQASPTFEPVPTWATQQAEALKMVAGPFDELAEWTTFCAWHMTPDKPRTPANWAKWVARGPANARTQRDRFQQQEHRGIARAERREVEAGYMRPPPVTPDPEWQRGKRPEPQEVAAFAGAALASLERLELKVGTE